MRWLRQISLSWLQLLCIRIVQCGRIPNHIAFIMDGNRRYATKKKIERVEGHRSGFEKMSETLQWCIYLGVTEATVYAFSVENFKRSEDEVQTLMDLARENFTNLLNEEDNIMANGIKVRVVGNLHMLPEDIKELVAKIIVMSKDNSKVFLNIAVAYTSRMEITNAISGIVEGIEDETLNPEDVSEELLTKCMYEPDIPDPELLIRTSGELRFSDFLLWQTPSACVYFTKQLWPEFGFWNLIMSILYYQRCYDTLSGVGQRQLEYSETHRRAERSDGEEIFLDKLNAARWKQIESYLPVEDCQTEKVTLDQ